MEEPNENEMGDHIFVDNAKLIQLRVQRRTLIEMINIANPPYRYLLMSVRSITNAYFQTVVDAIRVCPSLRYVHLSSNYVRLNRGEPYQSRDVLVFDYEDISSNVRAVMLAIHNNDSIHTLSFADLYLGDVGVCALARRLPICHRIRSLMLRNVHFGRNGLNALALGVRHSPHLRELIIVGSMNEYNHLDDPDDFVPDHEPEPAQIDLSESDWEFFGQNVGAHPALTRLVIRCVDFSESFAYALAHIIRTSTTLQSLEITWDDEVDVDGVYHADGAEPPRVSIVADALRVSPALTRFQMHEGTWHENMRYIYGEESYDVLWSAIARNPRLTDVVLSQNDTEKWRAVEQFRELAQTLDRTRIGGTPLAIHTIGRYVI